jgi:hypothetical protein
MELILVFLVSSHSSITHFVGGDRFFANAVPQAQILNQTLESIHTTNRNSQSPLIFNSASGLALLPDGAGAAAADLTVFNLTALEDVYTITAPVANRFSPGYLLAVDATGRLISTGVDRARAIYGYFSVWGSHSPIFVVCLFVCLFVCC